MKRVSVLLLFVLMAAPSFGQKSAPSDLQKQAKVTKEQATKTALARVPDGTIKEAELEKEKGKLVWSFDIARPKTNEITEVEVDAITGSVVSVTKESAEAEAKEQKAEQDKTKAKKPKQ